MGRIFEQGIKGLKKSISTDKGDSTNTRMSPALVDYVFHHADETKSSDVAQALTRIAIIVITAISLAIYDNFWGVDSAIARFSIYTVYAYFPFSLIYLKVYKSFPGKFNWLRYITLTTDSSIVSFSIFAWGLGAAAFYPVYIWIIIGYGMRYGPHFMHFASAISLSGFIAASMNNSSWSEVPELIFGLALGMLVMPTFFLSLLRQLRKVNAKLEAKVEEKEYLATHDSLTQLPNRLVLKEQLLTSIAMAERHNKQLALLFIDFDGFKQVNDVLGHYSGDLLLKAFSERLKKTLRGNDLLSRHCGDEFMVVLDEQDSPQMTVDIVQRIMQQTVGEYDVEGQKIYINYSVGIAMCPQNGQTPDDLIKHADIAMYRAKENGGNTFQFYDKGMSEKIRQQLVIQNDIHKALEKDQFILHYQPIIDLNDYHVVGAEALIRWQHPEKGLLAPGYFIDVAERSKLINEIGQWVIEQVCRDLKEWESAGIFDLPVNINISGRQFMDSGFFKELKSILEKSEIDVSRIKLEVTEGVIVEDNEQSINIFNQLKESGFQLALDDFGTKYSSLSYLKRFPIDVLKIDRSFISGLPDDADDCSLVKTILAIGQNMKMKVVAEGVEDQRQCDMLSDWGCRYIQGYFFCKPVACHDFLKFVTMTNQD